jgi:hypothetical protein
MLCLCYVKLQLKLAPYIPSFIRKVHRGRETQAPRRVERTSLPMSLKGQSRAARYAQSIPPLSKYVECTF